MKLVIALLLLSSSIFASEKPEYSQDRLIVKVKAGEQLPTIKNAISSKKLFGNITYQNKIIIL